jgi:hypothetical protein
MKNWNNMLALRMRASRAAPPVSDLPDIARAYSLNTRKLPTAKSIKTTRFAFMGAV